MSAILQYGARPLRTKAATVTAFGEPLGALFDTLRAEMQGANGVGLAANQIGSNLAAFVLEVDGRYFEMANPEIWDGDQPRLLVEGCLSIPNYSEKVERWGNLIGTAQGRTGEAYQFRADGIFAQVVQHEMDHLNGTLFVDRLDPSKQRTFFRWWWGDEL